MRAVCVRIALAGLSVVLLLGLWSVAQAALLSTVSYSFSNSGAGVANDCDITNCENHLPFLFDVQSEEIFVPQFGLPDAALVRVDVTWTASLANSTTITNRTDRLITGSIGNHVSYLALRDSFFDFLDEAFGPDAQFLTYFVGAGESITLHESDLHIAGSQAYRPIDALFHSFLGSGDTKFVFRRDAGAHGESRYVNPPEGCDEVIFGCFIDDRDGPQDLHYSFANALLVTYTYCTPAGSAECQRLLPEPTSVALLAFALAGLGFARRRNPYRVMVAIAKQTKRAVFGLGMMLLAGAAQAGVLATI